VYGIHLFYYTVLGTLISSINFVLYIVSYCYKKTVILKLAGLLHCSVRVVNLLS